jgi:hypothetical protein
MRKPANLLTRDPREAGANLPLLSKNPPFAPATLIANGIAEPAFVFLFGNQNDGCSILFAFYAKRMGYLQLL